MLKIFINMCCEMNGSTKTTNTICYNVDESFQCQILKINVTEGRFSGAHHR